MKLLFNDMSLNTGGKFDIAGHWVPLDSAHSFHRVGFSIDLNRGSMTNRYIIELVRIMKAHDALRNKERPRIHFGFFQEN